MANKYWLKLALVSSFTALLFLFLLLFGSSHNKSNNSTIVSRRVLKSISINHGRELSSSSLEISHDNKVVTMSNGDVEVKFSNPGGDVIGIKYSGIKNLLDNRNKKTNRGYWDIVWGEGIEGDDANVYDKLQGTKFEIIARDEDHIEISFSKKWSNSSSKLPLSVEKRYVMLRDYLGYYTYGIFSHPKEAPAVEIGQIRAAFKLKQDKFEFMAISDDQQRKMPSAKDRKLGQPLAYPEAVLLTNTSDPQIQGEVDDKYQYSMDHKDRLVHGWISSNPAVGFWVITPSQEFLAGGPTKQELTSHVGPISLCMFSSCHYVGRDMIIKLEEGESWTKVFGPVSVYLNSVPNNEPNIHKSLWENAKLQAQEEASKWPYSFTESSELLPSSDQRGTVTGQLLVSDRYINETIFEANSAYVGLAAPGEAGSWQTESKGYQFWVKADEKGNFIIKNVRPGKYNLYAFVPGIIGDYVYESVTIEPGSKINLENLVYEPPRNGPALWEIGVPDRTAAEYFIPDPLPSLENRLYVNKTRHKYRQYGLWDRYTDLYPDQDLIYTVNTSDYRRDWFFAHVNRKVSDGTYGTTTWQVRFEIENVAWDGSYTLRIALASSTNTHLQVRINDANSRHAFLTHQIGRDNSIARHGIHGVYRVFTIEIPSNLLREGTNTLFLSQISSNTPFAGIFYDYIRFEAPDSIF